MICPMNLNLHGGSASVDELNALDGKKTARQLITVIPARRRVGSQRTAAQVQKIRVAAYCRVSTDSEEQETSYEAQVSHYTKYIKSKPEWQMVEVYADDGISGTNTAKRDEFNRMIADCEAGKIDLILTKSISRFSRNICRRWSCTAKSARPSVPTRKRVQR